MLVTRTIGGHVFWPAHRVDNKNTINQARGGKGIYDRFDITLAELKHYFKIKIECDVKKLMNISFINLYMKHLSDMILILEGIKILIILFVV